MIRVLALVALAGVVHGQESRPADAASLNAEAVRLLDAGRLDEALAAITRARALDSRDETLVVNHARLLTRVAQKRFEQADYRGAQTDLERALEIAPREMVSRVQLAIVLRTMGRVDQARTVIEKALADDPKAATAWEEFARILYDDEDLTSALEALKTALAHDPTREPALKDFREKLEREIRIEEGWYRCARGPFLVKYDDAAFKSVGEQILRDLEDAELIARRTLGHTPERTVVVILYTHDDFTTATGAHAWTGGLFDGKIRLPVRNYTATRDSVRATLAHEYTHVVVRDLTRKCPTWLNEGLAQLAEGRSTATAGETLMRRPDPVSVTSFPQAWTHIADGAAVAAMYAQALLFTDYLVREFGYPTIKDILVRTNAAKTFAEAFSAATNRTIEDVEADWRRGR